MTIASKAVTRGGKLANSRSASSDDKQIWRRAPLLAQSLRAKNLRRAQQLVMLWRARDRRSGMAIYEFFKDFAAPLATVIAAAVAAWITFRFSSRQTEISQSQADIALDKLKFDLFERR